MSCLPVPGLSLCHLLSSAGAFSVRLTVGRPGSPDIGAAVRFAVTFVAIRRRNSRPHPEPLAGRKRSATSQSLAASSLLRRRDPGAGFSGRRSLGQFRSPTHPGLRQWC